MNPHLPERFGQAPPEKRAGEIASWLWEASAEDIAAAGFDGQLAMLETLTAGHGYAPGALALAKLYLAMPIDPEFLAAEKPAEARLAAALRADPQLAAARRDWLGASLPQKMAALRLVCEAACRVWQVAPPRIELCDVPAERGFINLAEYRPDDRTIVFNAAFDGALESFGPSLNHALHETRHHIQSERATRGEAGAAARQLRAFAANIRAYVTRDDLRGVGAYVEGDAYRAQPLEADAFRFAAAIAAAYGRPDPAPATPRPARKKALRP